MKSQSIKLCCGKKGCPEVKVVKGKIKIADDYGNVVVMTAEQAKLLGDAVSKLLT